MSSGDDAASADSSSDEFNEKGSSSSEEDTSKEGEIYIRDTVSTHSEKRILQIMLVRAMKNRMPRAVRRNRNRKEKPHQLEDRFILTMQLVNCLRRKTA